MLVGTAASGAAALSLGNAQGTTVLGRPLDLVFEVRTDGAEVADACIQVDVIAGDVPISASQVRVTPLAPRGGRGAAIRVQTIQPINEPVLSVRISAGCSGSVVRTYAVLAYPVESLSAPQMAAANAEVVPARREALPAVQTAPAAPAVRTRLPTRTARSKAARAEAAAQAGAERPKRTRPAARAPAPKPAVVDAGRPRLVMEPLSDWLETPSVLRASQEMAPLSPVSPELRAEAAARWRVLNMQPQDMLEEAARLVAQEAELAKQRAQAEGDKAAALQVQQQLQQRVAERFPAIVVYALVALLALLAGALLWLWSRQRRLGRLEEHSWTQAAAPDNVVDSAQAPLPAVAPTAHVNPSARLQPAEPELLPSGMMPLEFGPLPTAALKAVTAVVNPEDLFDLQQQAEFFVSVGEHDQAIDVMKQHIEANQSSSPLAYLELLRLYRSLSRIEQFNALRAQFHQHFNAQVPEFAVFSHQGKTLFGYPEVLARIEALWCDPSVVPLLQELIFRSVGHDHQRFDLPAYDDLLLLHAVARTTPASSRGVASPRTRTTPLEPEVELSSSQAELTGSAPAPFSNLMEFEPDWNFEAPEKALTEPVPSSSTAVDLDLDLDLSDLTHPDAMPEQANPAAPLPLLTQEEQPPVPGTAPPEPHQPVGFGSNSDRFEARVDPDVRKPS